MNKKKELILSLLKNNYCRLKPSKISGVGVFAIRNIPPGTDVFQGILKQEWLKFNMKELEELPKETKKLIDVFFVVEKDNSVLIPEGGLNGIDISFFVNNSNKPNLEFNEKKHTFISMKEIKKGKELTVSYSTYDYKWK